MNTRRILIVVALIAGLGLVGLQQASARGWGGGGNGDGCFCQGNGPGYQQLDDATKAKVDAFKADTQDIRKQMAMKRAEKQALMGSQTPDAAAVAKVAGELFDLRTEMSEKAKEAGVPMMRGQGRDGRIAGKWGHGQGRKHRPCFNRQSLN